MPAHQLSSDLLSDTDTPKIQAHYSPQRFGQKEDQFQDENQPMPTTGPSQLDLTAAEGRFGHLDVPAGVQLTGDANEDVDQLLKTQVCTSHRHSTA